MNNHNDETISARDATETADLGVALPQTRS